MYPTHVWLAHWVLSPLKTVFFAEFILVFHVKVFVGWQCLQLCVVTTCICLGGTPSRSGWQGVPHPGGGGYPILAGYPIPGEYPIWGYPIPGGGGVPSQGVPYLGCTPSRGVPRVPPAGLGVPHPEQGVPQVSPTSRPWLGYLRDGVPPTINTWPGYPPTLGWGTPPDLGWGTPLDRTA